MRWVVVFLFLLTGCTISATRNEDTMELRGFGAKRATWADGASIEKDEPIQVPEVVPSDIMRYIED